jgi:hypothetical protein
MMLYKFGDFKRAVLLCGLVGTWLVALNQGSEILAGRLNLVLYLRVVLDYATPFLVSSLTGLLRNWSDARDPSS